MDPDDDRPARPAMELPRGILSEPGKPAVGANPDGGDHTLEKRLRELNARLRSRRRPPVDRSSAGGAITPPPTERTLDRLAAFSRANVSGIEASLGQIPRGVWPRIDGCLGVLFTSRSGSRYLARELASRYQIGLMEESLNPHRVRGIAPADIVRSYADGWFSFKLGVPGIISAELCGVMAEYVDRTSFILLRRRDIIAQAVSLVKANQTEQWHSSQTARCSPNYDRAMIAHSIHVIEKAVASLGAYVRCAGRPWRALFYEDFENGDFSAAMAICDEFRVPRPDPGERRKADALERTSDSVNAAWIERFRDEMDDKTCDIIARYVETL